MDLIDDPAPGENAHEFSVSEISGAVKRVLEGEFGRVRVRGEIGRVFPARSGHLYFDLKDDRNVLASVTWKGQVSALTVRPEEGMEVVATGRLTTFGSQSKYQLNVEDIRPAGVGALMAMLEKRKKLLEAEGLFAPERKQELPFLPEVIGVVTSPGGAVIRDILHRLRDRFPRKVLIWPVAVQGDKCAPDVARAIDGFNALEPGGALPRPDLLIVARGGGSIEDLWGFNEEIVARAAAASKIPLISAVGHETDTTLIDFVSDRRAPTPTAAAELAVPVRLDLLAWVEGQGARLTGALTRSFGQRKTRLADVARALPRPEALIDPARQRLDFLDNRLPQALKATTQRQKLRLSESAGSLRPAALRRMIADRADKLEQVSQRLTPSLLRNMARRQDRLKDVSARIRSANLIRDIAHQKSVFQQFLQRLSSSALAGHMARKDRLAALERMRQTLGYQATLQRGYVVVRSDGQLVPDKASAENASALELEFRDGKMSIGAKPSKKPKQSPPEQGSLF